MGKRSLLVRRAVEQIPDDADRGIIRLFFFEQLSMSRIAERFGWTYDQVRERYRRGIRQLERLLQTLKPD